ncbi:MAG: rhomboid family intramembrane serine protease [Gemmatimonadetes bacterium]|nr:rhomboid family intramembrane serine protease [Gemmatimonadota bacterium]MDA1103140.1 rhomboid family intramembrane serine protease [Gemmatimonadota bacterium]
MSYDTRFGLNFMLTPMVKRLLIANGVVFALTLGVGERLMFEWFAFQPTEIVFRPWGPLTYMFLHGDLGHLAINMLVLFFFGPPLEARWGPREFLRFYLVCGLGGVALSYVFLPASIVGASAATYGVMLAFAMNWPNIPIYVFGIFPVLAKYLVGFMALTSLLSAVDSTQGGSNIAHFAHLGGLIAAFLYLKADWRTGEALQGLQRATRKKRRLAIVPRDEAEEESAGRAPSRKQAREDAALYDRVDAVLDKISAEGMSSLTAAELKLLDDVSKKHRAN